MISCSTWKKVRQTQSCFFIALHLHNFQILFLVFLIGSQKKVEKEKNVYLEMMIYIPALLQNSSITWGVSEMGTHMCSYNSRWCYRPFCLLRNSSNFRWWGWYVMHSSSEFLFRNFFWDILELKKILGFLFIFVRFVEKVWIDFGVKNQKLWIFYTFCKVVFYRKNSKFDF